ncbi:hypothetical protein AVP_151 [Aerococcus phage vB_AviM_AVP]|nr:hypothetical protein AVP_151 [Aerococcus phage vB_AviM_AVP]
MVKLIKDLDGKATSVENYMKELITDTEFLDFLKEYIKQTNSKDTLKEVQKEYIEYNTEDKVEFDNTVTFKEEVFFTDEYKESMFELGRNLITRLNERYKDMSAEDFIEEFWDTNYNYGQEVVRDYIADTAVGANTFFIPVENLEDYIVEDTAETVGE